MSEAKPDLNAKRTLEELWNEAQLHLDVVVRNALRPWKQHHQADDVNRFKQRLSEKLLRKNKKPLGDLLDEAKLKPWLQKIANREVNRVLQRESRNVSFDDAPPEVFEQKPEQEELLLRKEQRNLVKEILPELPPRKQELAELALQEFSDEEIARKMGLKVVTVYKRKSETLTKLREIVEARQKKLQRDGKILG